MPWKVPWCSDDGSGVTPQNILGPWAMVRGADRQGRPGRLRQDLAPGEGPSAMAAGVTTATRARLRAKSRPCIK